MSKWVDKLFNGTPLDKIMITIPEPTEEELKMIGIIRKRKTTDEDWHHDEDILIPDEHVVQ